MKNSNAKDKYFKDIKTLLSIRGTQEKEYLAKISLLISEDENAPPSEIEKEIAKYAKSRAEKGGKKRLRHGYNTVRPCHLRRGRKRPLAGLAEPQRANVSPYPACGKPCRQ